MDDDAYAAQAYPGQSIARRRLAASVSGAYGVGTSTTVRALFTGLLQRTRELVLGEVDDLLAPLKTSHTRYQVLAIVCRSPDGLQLGELADRAFVKPSTMTSTIDRLLRDGLIERQADPADRRGILAVATPKGHKLYEKARTILEEAEFGLGGVDLGTLTILVECLDKVAGALEPEPKSVR